MSNYNLIGEAKMLIYNLVFNEEARNRDKKLFEDLKNDTSFRNVKILFEDGINNRNGFFYISDKYPASKLNDLREFKDSSVLSITNSFVHEDIEKERKAFKESLEKVCHPGGKSHLIECNGQQIISFYQESPDGTPSLQYQLIREEELEKYYKKLNDCLKAYKVFIESEKITLFKCCYLNILFLTLIIFIALYLLSLSLE